MNLAEQLIEKWPSAIVARAEVKRFSGGILSGKTLANLAAAGEAVPPAVRIGGKCAYPARPLAEFIASRVTNKGGKQ